MVLVLVKINSSTGPESAFGAFRHLLSVQKKHANLATRLSPSPKPSSFKSFSIPQGLGGSKSSSEKSQVYRKITVQSYSRIAVRLLLCGRIAKACFPAAEQTEKIGFCTHAINYYSEAFIFNQVRAGFI